VRPRCEHRSCDVIQLVLRIELAPHQELGHLVHECIRLCVCVRGYSCDFPSCPLSMMVAILKSVSLPQHSGMYFYHHVSASSASSPWMSLP
jgi:hypothetical protein